MHVAALEIQPTPDPAALRAKSTGQVASPVMIVGDAFASEQWVYALRDYMLFSARDLPMAANVEKGPGTTSGVTRRGVLAGGLIHD